MSMVLILDVLWSKQVFRFVEGNRLHRQSRKSDFFVGKDLFYFLCAQHVLSYHFTPCCLQGKCSVEEGG